MFQVLLLALFLAPGEKSELKKLIDEAIRRNPEILAAQKKLEAARQRPAMEASLPDPMFSAGYAAVGGPLPGQGLGREPMARLGFMASQTLPAAGKRDLRSRIALKDAGAAEQEYWQVQLSVVARVKTAWHTLHHTYAMLDLVAANRVLTERMLKVAEARYAVGKASQADLLKAQTQWRPSPQNSNRRSTAAKPRSTPCWPAPSIHPCRARRKWWASKTRSLWRS